VESGSSGELFHAGLSQRGPGEGETSQDAWETGVAQDSRAGQKSIDERSRNTYYESAFSIRWRFTSALA